jgi:uncharacterized protein
MTSIQKIGLAALGLGALLGIAALLYSPIQKTTSMSLATTTIIIGSTTILAEVAHTNEERSRGLSGRTSLPDGQGMWFVFDTDGLWGFWMKDTLIPLDMLWVAEDGTIVTIAHNVAPGSFPRAYKPTRPARYVLELPGGYAAKQGIAEGDKVIF